jgi:hypothetical protein
VTEFAHQARTERRPLNIFVTVRAPKDTPDTEGKRIISRRIGHLGEKLKRNGQEHIGVTVYEKGPYLHAHHLAYVAPKNLKLVLGMNQGEDGDVHVRQADWFAPVYATKQRKWMGPEIEDKIATQQGRRPWEKGIHIAGTRLSFTKEAKAIVARRTGLAVVAPATAALPEPVVHPPVIPPNPLPVVAAIPEQLPLFGALPERHYLPPSDLRSFRQVQGCTQAEVSGWIGIKDRSHIANFERGHDRLSLQRQRALKHFMETRRLTA